MDGTASSSRATRSSRPRTRASSSQSPGSSSSTSPERNAQDDTDSFMEQGNDSQSSLGVSTLRDMYMASPRAERQERLPPICRLPPELLLAIFSRLGSTSNLKNCMLVNKSWAVNSVEMLWHRPLCNNLKNLTNVTQTIRKTDGFFAYYDLVKRLNLSTLTGQVSDGTAEALSVCKRVERLTLTGCTMLTDQGVKALVEGNKNLLALDISGLNAVTDVSLEAVAQHSVRLQGLNITGCREVTDKSMVMISQNCKNLKRLKLNHCHHISDATVLSLANNCPALLEIDLHECRLITSTSVSALLSKGRHLREVRLANCSNINNDAFLTIEPGRSLESLRILDLTSCDQLDDAAVQKIITVAPRLRNLVLAKCRQITDRGVRAITKLGKNLHYIHLGHCQQITDAAVVELIKSCNRIRYIDLACCINLTDDSIKHLATLPKLRRIGLVKCHAVTDLSILALARARPAPGGGPIGPSCLERVHLSYCVHLTLQGIHSLLNHCPRLTHLSLTGVQAFLREDLTTFCREAPAEFTDHQRDVFCVFSGPGVARLKNYLNQEALQYETDGTMYDDGEDGHEEDIEAEAEGEDQTAGMMGAIALGNEADEDWSEIGAEEAG